MADNKKHPDHAEPHGTISRMRSWETKHWITAVLILVIAIAAFLASWD